MQIEVVIVGAGPAGLATAACLNNLSIPNIIIEKENCYAHLWRNKTFDRLKLHLAKEFCTLPHMPHEESAETYILKADFLKYLDKYVQKFNLNITYNTPVKSACYNESVKKWIIKATNELTGDEHVYESKFLVVATGENAEGFIPEIPGLATFKGEMIHSCQYKSGKDYEGKRVLVVGSGNSGMEIAYDLCNHGAKTSIAIRSPFHVLTKEFIHMAMIFAKHHPIKVVDLFLLYLSWLHYGNLSKYGIYRPTKGPMQLRQERSKAPVIDVGTVEKIKSGEIQVVKELIRVGEDEAEFKDGKVYTYDAIVFATGYKSTANYWLKDEGRLMDSEGFPKESFPNHWFSKDGIYCAGFSRRGLDGIALDAKKIASHIHVMLTRMEEQKSLAEEEEEEEEEGS